MDIHTHIYRCLGQVLAIIKKKKKKKKNPLATLIVEPSQPT